MLLQQAPRHHLGQGGQKWIWTYPEKNEKAKERKLICCIFCVHNPIEVPPISDLDIFDARSIF